MSMKTENLTTRQYINAFSGTFAANGVQVGTLIDLNSIYKVCMAGADGNTANTTAKTGYKAKSIDFYITVQAYTSGTFTPVVEGVGLFNSGLSGSAQLGYALGTQLTPAVVAGLLPANPVTTTTYAVNPIKLVAYNYNYNPVPQSGGFITYSGLTGAKSGSAIFPMISNAMSRSDAVITTNPAMVFSFSVLPAFGNENELLSFVRLSFSGTNTSVGQIIANAVVTYEAVA